MLLILLTLATASALAAPNHELVGESGEFSKKDLYLHQKEREPTGASPPVGHRAARPIWAHNLRTHEIAVLDGPGALQPGDPQASFFRCWFTQETGDIPQGLIAAVLAAARHFETREIQVISGFRHPKYNLMLRKKGRQVAARSQHTRAKAIDFLLPEVATETLYRWLLQHHRGGVGFYPVSQFVHVDLGRKRTWRGT